MHLAKSPEGPMELSVIFVNWNALTYLRECLASIYEYTPGLSFEIIVVDNASPEGQVDTLYEQFPDISIVKSDVNLGFAGANNLGFRHARGNYLMFLNPDTQLTGPAIPLLLEQIKSLPNAGIVGCKLLNTDRTIQTSCIQTFPTLLNQLFDVEYLQLRWPHVPLWNIAPLFSESQAPSEVEVVSGACMLLSREVFQRAGGFSEDYFMYAEDIDLCFKVKRLKLRNYYVGHAELVHHGGKSTDPGNRNQWSTVMKLKAVEKFCIKYHGHFYGALYRGMMGGAAIARLSLLLLAKPFLRSAPRQTAIQKARSKWATVLKWSLGFAEG